MLNNQGLIIQEVTTTIAVGQTTSPTIEVDGLTILKFWLPVNFNGAKLTFKLSNNNVDFYDYYNALGEQVELVTVGTRVVGITSNDFLGVKHLKIIQDVQALTNTTITMTTQRIA